MRSLIIIVLLCLACTPYCTADDIKIFAVNEPPSSYTDSSGHIVGFSIDVVRAIQARIGDNSKIQIVPEARALLTARKKPNILLLAYSRTAEREDNFHWITLLLRKPWVMYSKSANSITLNNLDDAKSISNIGVVIGDVREKYLSSKGFTNLYRNISHQQNLKMLNLNRIELLFYEPLGMAYLCDELGIPLANFNPVFFLKSTDVYLMMSKNNSSTDLVNKWQEASRAIKNDGTFETITNEWSLKIRHETGLNYGLKDGALDLLE